MSKTVRRRLSAILTDIQEGRLVTEEAMTRCGLSNHQEWQTFLLDHHVVYDAERASYRFMKKDDPVVAWTEDVDDPYDMGVKKSESAIRDEWVAYLYEHEETLTRLLRRAQADYDVTHLPGPSVAKNLHVNHHLYTKLKEHAFRNRLKLSRILEQAILDYLFYHLSEEAFQDLFMVDKSDRGREK